MRRIYLDRIAATPLAPGVFEAMRPFLEESFGNPQSLHSPGQDAAEAVAGAREGVAALIGAAADEVIFTGSGTEANNMAVKGLALARKSGGSHLVLSAIEHSSVLNAARALERSGFQTTLVRVDGTGRVDPADVVGALRKETVLVSVQLANSEVGTIEPVAEIARAVRERGVLVHTDAVAAAGSLRIDVGALGVDALSLAGGPFGGPKGSAALFLRKGTRFIPLFDGGVQEGGRRGGSEDVPAIVGLGRAAEAAAASLPERSARLTRLRDRLIGELTSRVEHVRPTGHPIFRLPYHASFCIRFVEGEALLLSLDFKGVAASSFSACTSKSLKVSHVLLAMGLDHETAQGSLIFSLLDTTPDEDVDALLDILPPVVERLRGLSPLYTAYLKEHGR